jgi:indolepyruvate ferredoxin oxidoreductase alpha subunit
MKTELLLGDEAVALGAVDAGIAGAFSYPGTPATEIFEAIEAYAKGEGSGIGEQGSGVRPAGPEADASPLTLHPSPLTPHTSPLTPTTPYALPPNHIWAQWSANEKVAYEEALGMSYAGKRAIVSMKHVGLNVAADPFVSSAITGVNGGLLLVVADDPGMHSSQNEQDSRYYGEFAKVPIFEPSSQQEAYDMAREAFEYSERIKLPVMMRLVTRLAHSRANVVAADENRRALRDTIAGKSEPGDWTLVPSNARRRFRRLLDVQPELRAYAERSPFNKLHLAGRRGIVASGIAYNYVREALGDSDENSLLKIGVYPVPAGLMRELVDHCEEIVVVEEGYPFIEERLHGLLGVPGKTIRGKLGGPLPPDGELTPEIVATGLGMPFAATVPPETNLVGRAPQLCKGCPHADTFRALTDATAGHDGAVLFSDIGCYTLGAFPPYNAVHSTVDMGASISMAHGASQAGAYPVICTIGDSTFAHSGMTPLLGAVRADANITVVILDNATVAMTGAQESMASDQKLIDVLHGLGVKEPVVFEPLPKKHEETVAILREAIAHEGLSVLVARRACIQLKPQKPPTKAATTCELEGETTERHGR